MIYDLIIVGGGASGLFAAANIKKGKKVLILEKKIKPGRKLLLSGSGKCNITNDSDITTFFDHYGKNGRFLKHVLHSFTNKDLINYFQNKGVKFSTDKNDKFFPTSEKAGDIFSILLREATNRAKIVIDSKVNEIVKENELFSIKTDMEEYLSKALLLSTGGASYPETGSSGDGALFAESFGHKISKLKPALSPVFIKNHNLAELSGISMKASLKIGTEKKNHQGDLLITHKGFSGPLILNNSWLMDSGQQLKINFISMNGEEFKDAFMEKKKFVPAMRMTNFLKSVFTFSENLCNVFMKLASIEQKKRVFEVSKSELNKISNLLTAYQAQINKVGGFDIAMGTKGGIITKEINSKTMESKIVENLFFAGEVIDIIGDTGGYNLQAAFSTAFVAAKSLSDNK